MHPTPECQQWEHLGAQVVCVCPFIATHSFSSWEFDCHLMDCPHRRRAEVNLLNHTSFFRGLVKFYKERKRCKIISNANIQLFIVSYLSVQSNYSDLTRTVETFNQRNSWPMQTKNKPVSIKPATLTWQYNLFQINLFTSFQATPNAWYGATSLHGSCGKSFITVDRSP